MPTIKEARLEHIKAAAGGQVTDPAGLLCAWEWLQAELESRWAALHLVEAIDSRADIVPRVAWQVNLAAGWRDQIAEQFKAHAPELWSQAKGARHV